MPAPDVAQGDNHSLAVLHWGPWGFRTDYYPPAKDGRFDEILHRLRMLTAEPVGTLVKFIVDKRGGLWVAEEP